MRKMTIAAALGLVALGANAGIKVEMKGFASDSLQMVSTNILRSEQLVPYCTLVSKNGVVQIEDLSEPACVMFLPKGVNSEPVTVYIAPGEDVTATLTYADGMVESKLVGTKVNELMSELKNKQQAIVKQAIGASEEKRDSLLTEYNKVMTDYVKENMDSPITLWAIMRCDVTTAEREAMLMKVGENAKKSIFGPLEGVISTLIEREKEAEVAKKMTAEREVAPDFTLNKPDGSEFKMSSLRGKWVLLDFWGSWCGWCIKGIPQMKQVYEKYKDKMEIVSVACRDKKEKWVAAIDKHELNWIHVISLEEVPGTGKKVEHMYGVEGYPTKLLINPEGKIVKRCVGEDPNFYGDFEELMK